MNKLDLYLKTLESLGVEYANTGLGTNFMRG
jgi:hypothetical protein